MTSRLVIFALLAVPLFLVSCGKPKELPYNKLGYHSGIFTEPGTDKPFTGLAKESYNDGKPKAEYPCRKGKFHGTVKEWHANGKPSAETEFNNGERTGLNREWTESGQPYMERVYDHDRIVSEKKYEIGK
jgi:antitoxin component YwqK of YwqJK toxin-antitoxin module